MTSGSLGLFYYGSDDINGTVPQRRVRERKIYMNEKDTILIKGLVAKALDKVYELDYHLILNNAVNSVGKDEHHHVGERSILFRFAHYLQNLLDEYPQFDEYNLDCEYNRNGSETKNLPSFPNGTYPDVILHKRGSNDDNILIIEFKTYWNTDQTQDFKKIDEFTNESGKYHFKIGMAIRIDKLRKDVRIHYFPEK